MSIGLIRAVESHTGTTASTSETSFTFGVGQAGDSPKGIVVFTVGASNVEYVSAVTYGGQSLVPVSGGSAVDTSGEPGRVTAWFLGAGLPTGAQNVVVSRTSNLTVIYAVAFLLSGARDTRVAGTPVLQEQSGAITAVTYNDGLDSLATSLVLACAYSGDNTPAPAGGTGTTTAHTLEGGYAFSVGAGYETTPTYGSRSRGMSQDTADDRAHVVLAVTDQATITGAAVLTGMGTLTYTLYRHVYDTLAGEAELVVFVGDALLQELGGDAELIVLTGDGELKQLAGDAELIVLVGEAEL